MKEGRLSVDNLHGLPFTIQNLCRRAENRNGHPALDEECGTAVGKIPLNLQGFGERGQNSKYGCRRTAVKEKYRQIVNIACSVEI